ncbi:uncharacterized protein LOC141648897 [Silene latifolia]|uniref:uncharacterized protein LOC141648897 n=1 Tax=Silene latifolia TaxID=37657 RepID=UPI003D786F77
MKIFGLDVKYWGGESLRKLSSGVGKFIKCDDPTLHKQFLGFACIMVEVDVDQQFPSVVDFLDENGKNQSVRIEYDWLPVSCTACKGVGHTAEKCRKGMVKQPVTKKVWKPRKIDPKQKEPAKQPPVRKLVQGLTKNCETKIKSRNWNKVTNNICSNWAICTNSHLHSGGRIWIIWDPALFEVDILDVTIQCIHTKVFDKARRKGFYFTVVYGLNSLGDREPLWQSIKSYHLQLNSPWLLCGDFNAIMERNERIGGAEITNAELRPMADAIRDCQLTDMKWLEQYPDSFAHFLPEGLFDHCPGLVHFEEERQRRGNSFKYYNMWSMAKEYKEVVIDGWSREVQGTPMFKIVSKLKGLKKGLLALNKDNFEDIENLTNLTELSLKHFQSLLVSDPYNKEWIENERACAQELTDMVKARDQFLKQKAKCDWMKYGDENTLLFPCRHQEEKGKE